MCHELIDDELILAWGITSFFYNSVAQNVLHLVKHRVEYFCPGNSTDPTDPAGSNPSVELDPM